MADGNDAAWAWTTARSSGANLPTMVALYVRPVGSVTLSELAPATTCALVTTSPLWSNTTPDPSPWLVETCTTSGDVRLMTLMKLSWRSVCAAGLTSVTGAPRTVAAGFGLDPAPQPATAAATVRSEHNATTERDDFTLSVLGRAAGKSNSTKRAGAYLGG